jgi:THO complex subunit 1
MDFLLALSGQARDKLAETLPATASINKAVMYGDQVLSEEDVSINLKSRVLRSTD